VEWEVGPDPAGQTKGSSCGAKRRGKLAPLASCLYMESHALRACSYSARREERERAHRARDSK